MLDNHVMVRDDLLGFSMKDPLHERLGFEVGFYAVVSHTCMYSNVGLKGWFIYVFCPFKIFFSLCFVSPGIGTFSTWTYVILHFFIHSNHIWFPLGVLERLATKALLELKQGVVAYINIRHVHGASVTCLSHV